MNLLASIRNIAWRPVAGLLLAGLLGWLAAWFMLPSGPNSAVPQGTAPGAVPQPLASPMASAPKQDGADMRSQGLDQLLQSQAKISEGAARSIASPPALPAPHTAPALAANSAKPSAQEAARAAKIKAMQELQTTALAEVQAVPPGDTKKLMAAMERFDAQMRAAGAPSIIDMDKLRKTLEGANRLQELNRQVTAETEKGRNADANKIQALIKEIQATQKQMPQQFIKNDVLQKQLAR